MHNQSKVRKQKPLFSLPCRTMFRLQKEQKNTSHLHFTKYRKKVTCIFSNNSANYFSKISFDISEIYTTTFFHSFVNEKFGNILFYNQKRRRIFWRISPGENFSSFFRVFLSTFTLTFCPSQTVSLSFVHF